MLIDWTQDMDSRSSLCIRAHCHVTSFCGQQRTGFLVVRALLGLAEAGYIPGAIYTLSTWYSRKELAKRVAVLFFGMFGGNAISPLLGAGLLKLDGKRGLAGWQRIFLRMLFLVKLSLENVRADGVIFIYS